MPVAACIAPVRAWRSRAIEMSARPCGVQSLFETYLAARIIPASNEHLLHRRYTRPRLPPSLFLLPADFQLLTLRRLEGGPMLSAIFPASCLPRLNLQLLRRFQSPPPRCPFLFLHHFRSLRHRDYLHHHQGLSQCRCPHFSHHLRTHHHLHCRLHPLCPSPFQHQLHSSRLRRLHLSHRH